MDLLENLYHIENFGIYLFMIIGALIVLFLVILFFGKKDEKKRKLEETKKLEAQNGEVPQAPIPAPENLVTPVVPNVEVPTNPVTLEVPSLSSTPEPILQPETSFPFKEVEDHPTPIEVPTPVLEKTKVPDLASVALSQIAEEQKEAKEEPMEEIKKDVPEKIETPQAEKEFDFDALADAINKELTSIEKSEEKEPTPVLPKTEDLPLQYSVVEPQGKEPKYDLPKEEPKVEKKVMPTVFSSVYVNREKEEPMVMPKKEEIVEPVVPKIELPKTIELPKKNNE